MRIDKDEAEQTDDGLLTTETGELYTDGKKRRRGDFIAKILCVLFAFLFWLYVMNEDSPTFEKLFTDIPIEIINIDPDSNLSVISGYDNTVDITLVGKRRDVLNVESADLRAYVDASAITEAGTATLEIITEVPGNLRETEKTKSSVRIYFDEKDSVQVPVEVVMTEFSLADGYELGDTVPNIEEVTVTGPAVQLSAIDSAQVVLSGLGRLTDSLIATGSLQLVDAQGEVLTSPYLKLQTKSVSVNIPVYITKEVPLTVAYKHGYFNDSNAEVTVIPSTILLKGEASVLNGIDELMIATIDEKKTSEETTSHKIELPAGTESIHGIQYVQYKVTLKNTSTKQLVIREFSVNNPNNLKYELAVDSITLTMRGETRYVSFISAASVDAYVDLSNLSNVTGNVTVPVTFTVNSMYNGYVYELGDYNITVKIS
ncbi:MAG: hypothetical protein J6I45_06125 [Clostridia bacterium]|nr:hypothetical protein [Clostridia bacterium]